jgi:hypothetical protein
VENIKNKSKEFVLSKGADLVGIASVNSSTEPQMAINLRTSYLVQKLLLLWQKEFQIV